MLTKKILLSDSPTQSNVSSIPTDSGASLTSRQAQPTAQEKSGRPVITDHFVYQNNEKDPEIIKNYERALALVQQINPRVLSTSYFCKRSGDWYILDVNLKSDPADAFRVDDDVYIGTRDDYVVDMSRDHVLRCGDLDALTPIFEMLKTRKPLPSKLDERGYLCDITTIMIAATPAIHNIVEPDMGYYPEEVDFPKYEIFSDSIVYTWFANSPGMANITIKYTITWDGKKATYQSTELYGSGPYRDCTDDLDY